MRQEDPLGKKHLLSFFLTEDREKVVRRKFLPETDGSPVNTYRDISSPFVTINRRPIVFVFTFIKGTPGLF